MKHLTLAAVMALLSAPAFAQVSTQGDAAAGEEAFARQCVACHVVQNGDTVLAGRNSKTGPNLYLMPGRTPGTQEGFDYGDAMIAFGAMGAVWDETNFVGYVQDPTGYLREMLGDNRARGKMSFQVRNEEDAYDIYAYLVQLSAQ